MNNDYFILYNEGNGLAAEAFLLKIKDFVSLFLQLMSGLLVFLFAIRLRRTSLCSAAQRKKEKRKS